MFRQLLSENGGDESMLNKPLYKSGESNQRLGERLEVGFPWRSC